MSETVSEMRARLASQDSEIAQLREQIRALQNPRRQAPDVPYSALDKDFQLPSSRQMIQLFEAAGRQLPGVVRESTASYEGFALTLWALGASGIFEVIPDINRKYYATHWLDMINAWLVSRGRTVASGNSVHNLVLAAAALQIPYTPTDTLSGTVAGFGLQEGHRSPHVLGGHTVDPGSRPVRNRWLQTLSSGRALEPVPPPKMAQSPARVQFNITDRMKEAGVYW